MKGQLTDTELQATKIVLITTRSEVRKDKRQRIIAVKIKGMLYYICL